MAATSPQRLFSTNTLPPVHILMPAYNAAPFIRNALNSIIMQNYPHWTLFVIDDGSMDTTKDVIKKFLQDNSKHRDKIQVIYEEENKGNAARRKELWKNSREANSEAYIFWLDADDAYQDAQVLNQVILQMKRTKADICLIPFSIKYQDASQANNAAGLLNDKRQNDAILKSIFNSPQKYVSPLDANVNIMLTTSLGWTKCYAPTVRDLPKSADYPFHDFVAMAALLQVTRITTLDPSLSCIEYLRRCDSICGKRTPENFTLHIPQQLTLFLNAVLELPEEDVNRTKKIDLAITFVSKKLDQYKSTLENIVATPQYPDINQSTLDAYLKEARSLREFMREKSEQQLTYSPPRPQ